MGTREEDYYGASNQPAEAEAGNENDAQAAEPVIGINPYFPDESQEAAPVEPEAQDAPAPAADAAPTFDPATDAAAGIDVNSPEYKHFQAAFTRSTQRAKSELETELDRRLAALETQSQMAQVEQQTTVEATAPDGLYNISWNDFDSGASRLDADSMLAGNEAEIVAVVKPMIEHVLREVNEQNQAAQRAQVEVQTKAYLTNVANEIGKYGADKHQSFVNLMVENVQFARSQPVQFANYAVAKLGIDPNAQPGQESAPAPTPQTPASVATPATQVQPARPTATPAGPGATRPPKFKGRTAHEITEAAVAYAFDNM